eukprot:1160073-Pelagomonas_calceolata.AAC.2
MVPLKKAPEQHGSSTAAFKRHLSSSAQCTATGAPMGRGRQVHGHHEQSHAAGRRMAITRQAGAWPPRGRQVHGHIAGGRRMAIMNKVFPATEPFNPEGKLPTAWFSNTSCLPQLPHEEPLYL